MYQHRVAAFGEFVGPSLVFVVVRAVGRHEGRGIIAGRDNFFPTKIFIAAVVVQGQHGG